uniref:Uncharacterized protein n=1 Tax=Arundo donax TaxID=35708 RepID=A0A0A9D4R4_ARUDO
MLKALPPSRIVTATEQNCCSEIIRSMIGVISADEIILQYSGWEAR